MKKLFAYIFIPLVILAMVAYLSAAPLTGDGIQGGSGGTSFSATDITGATEDTTPATTSLAVLSQAGALIKSTLAEIATAIKGSYFGTLTNTKWCTTNGTLVACTENAPQPALGVLAGTLTNTYLCKYTAAGTLLSCDVDPATFQVAGSYQAADADLTYLAGFTPTANVKSILNAADYAAIKTLLGYYTSGDSPTFGTDTTTKQIYAAPTELTLSSNTDGNITATQTLHTVDTYDDQATGALDTIAAGTDGQVLYLRAAHTDRTVVLDETDNIIIPNGSQISLDSTSRWIALVYDAGLSKWVVFGGGLPDGIDVSSVSIAAAKIDSAGNVTGLAPSVVLTHSSGVHDGANDAATMTDSGESFTTSQFVGMTVYNVTDGSSCTVTANDGTTITCTLAGGTQNDWDTDDVWQVGPGPQQSGAWFYVVAAGTIRHPATAGYVACYESDATAVLTVEMNSDSMIFQGVLDTAVTALSAGNAVDSSGSTTGDYQCIHNKSATEAQGKGKRGTWVDGGAT